MPSTAELPLLSTEIYVDLACGRSLLRGADLYACGILASSAAFTKDQLVSVVVDLDRSLKRGSLQRLQGQRRLHVGNGRCHINRWDIMTKDPRDVDGIGVTMTETVLMAPALNPVDLQGLVIAQNLPSILVAHALQPMSSERILDACAAPGGKTLHTETLMQKKGEIMALERSRPKVEQLRQRLDADSIVQVFQHDASKADQLFQLESFDRILLDPPCSGLGQRPSLKWDTALTVKNLQHFAVNQQSFFETTYRLLRPGGVLVYSTCTIHPAENEGVVAWALRSFDDLELFDLWQDLDREMLQQFGAEMGIPENAGTATGAGLTVAEASKVVRFALQSSSTIGFFIAKFRKRDIPRPTR